MMTVIGAMSCGAMTPAQVLIQWNWLISTKWVTMRAGIGTMKLARIKPQKMRRPGKLSCEIA